jgi:hypothetical protein
MWFIFKLVIMVQRMSNKNTLITALKILKTIWKCQIKNKIFTFSLKALKDFGMIEVKCMCSYNLKLMLSVPSNLIFKSVNVHVY